MLQTLTMSSSGEASSSSRGSSISNSARNKGPHVSANPLPEKDFSLPRSVHTDPDSDSDHHHRKSPVHGKSPLHRIFRRAGSVTSDRQVRVTSFSGELHDAVDMTSSATPCNVAGILHKWVNYGKGWRPRWFELHGGVLYYYKVHGPDKLYVSPEILKGSRIIGEEAQRLFKKQQDKNAIDKRPKKAFGDVHLKVSSFRGSKSEDKKFYISSGTLTWNLRAETKEDTAEWLEALLSAKESYSGHPRTLPPQEEITMSTARLKARLEEEGLSEESINACEKMILSEFSNVQEQLKSLQQKRMSLINTLQQLEADKVELETTVVDEMHNQNHDTGHAEHGRYAASEIDSEDDQHIIIGAESDDEEETFFDTKETLASDSFHSHNLDTVGTLPTGKGSSTSTSGLNLIPLAYPVVNRRKRLPVPKEEEKAVSLWSLIKDNIGKDLTRVCLPVYFNEPISTLEKIFEDFEYSFLLDQAWQWGKQGNSLMRILNVAAFAVSGYASTDGRNCKPFNPLLGETYEAEYPDKGLRFFSEKVSHHPMVVACHCEGRGWKFWGDSNVKSKFWGRSIQLDPVGILTVEFDDGEIFRWTKVTTSIYNLILGKLYCDHYGTMRIQGNREHSCKLKFKEQSIMDRNPHQVQGHVQNKRGETLATLIGKWDESMSYVIEDPARPKGSDLMSDAHLLWKRSAPAQFPTRYNLTSFAITLNELTSGLKEKLPPTDSRLRPDQRHLENGEYEHANLEKLRLEQKQRKARKMQERGWQPRWFRKGEGKDTFQYVGGYWESREAKNWKDCADIFGPDSPEIS
ncbi:hypothetical protein O6H91_01G016300 [Diphasiastrum complanatum]|uniref:Uncharacterized protein n=2 Tax=Diphasiastrum complanatum TaxID=34168 RepID=A0ACC2ENG2_DIPCM|nr:hypothetical protein O6H91_01G016300 [Diphasiastrum complanatum]KAJ7568044.1 hypothetical protein O6H91_01G016300 [Diphasiastrum complanatum]